MTNKVDGYASSADYNKKSRNKCMVTITKHLLLITTLIGVALAIVMGVYTLVGCILLLPTAKHFSYFQQFYRTKFTTLTSVRRYHSNNFISR